MPRFEGNQVCGASPPSKFPLGLNGLFNAESSFLLYYYYRRRADITFSTFVTICVKEGPYVGEGGWFRQMKSTSGLIRAMTYRDCMGIQKIRPDENRRHG